MQTKSRKIEGNPIGDGNYICVLSSLVKIGDRAEAERVFDEREVEISCLLLTSVLKQSKDAQVMLKMGSTHDEREQHRLMRDAMEKRFTRGSRSLNTASFFRLQNVLAETRGVHDVFNVVGAGSATAAIFGPNHARNVMLGATVCFPLGWLQLKLMEKANEGKHNDTGHHCEVTSGVCAAIERLFCNASRSC